MTKRGRLNVRVSMGRTGQFIRWTLAGVLALVGTGTALASPATFSFTLPNAGWVPALRGGQPLFDPQGDTPGPRDIVGDASFPMLYVAADASHLYFRLRLNSDPRQNATNLRPFGWGCFINTDSDLTTYEFSTIVDGVNNPDQISFFKNTETELPNSPTDAPDLPPVSTVTNPLDAAVVHARVVEADSSFGGDTDYFLDWAIQRSDTDAAGLSTVAPATYYCGSSNNGSTIAADCSGSAAVGCPLDSQFSDPISCGEEGCGICGDTEVEGTEGCDDGGLLGGDGCSALCLIELGEPCVADNACESGFCDPDSNTCECDSDADCALDELCSTAPSPNACAARGCGNAVLETGEACDDGNLVPDDGCNESCLLELGEPCTLAAECASGFCDPADDTCACDEAADCAVGDLCNTATAPNVCVAPGCGNAVLELGEGCDDGNQSDGDGCNAQCLLELDQPCSESEECASELCSTSDLCVCDDDDDCAVGQNCNGEVCASPSCGDGSLDAGESCDDGNLNDDDGCNAQCLLELGEECADSSECASAFCDPDSDTCACDQSVDCAGLQVCDTSSAPNQCVDPGCGNAVLETGEACDDGNLNDDDGCSGACLIELTEPCDDSGQCQSGLCDPADGTCACDEAADCATGQLCDTGAEPNLCVDPGCGNNVLEPGEGCDDGNLLASDGCTADCLLELEMPCTSSDECASGTCDNDTSICVCDADSDCTLGEVCDLLGAPAECVPAGCGNGVLELGEGCDDANFDNADGCSSQCLIELDQPCTTSPACASGLCDPDMDVCTCDGHDDCLGGQVCNTVANPNVCVAPGCGNSTIEAGESCDDGNTEPGDGCDETCLRELGEECPSNPACASGSCDMESGVCECNDDGDCDGGVCDETQNPNTCAAPGCGDDVVQVGEGCDDGNSVPGDGCNSDCLVELDGDCEVDDDCASGSCDPVELNCACDDDGDCGDNEFCDDAPDPNQCAGLTCGDGVIDVDETCDDANVEDGDGCSVACAIEAGFECTGEPSLCEETGCEQDSDCAERQICEIASGECLDVECIEDSHCDDGETCDQVSHTCDGTTGAGGAAGEAGAPGIGGVGGTGTGGIGGTSAGGVGGTSTGGVGGTSTGGVGGTGTGGIGGTSAGGVGGTSTGGIGGTSAGGVGGTGIGGVGGTGADTGGVGGTDTDTGGVGGTGTGTDAGGAGGVGGTTSTTGVSERDKIYASGGGIVCSMGRDEAPAQGLVLLGVGLIGGFTRRRRRSRA